MLTKILLNLAIRFLVALPFSPSIYVVLHAGPRCFHQGAVLNPFACVVLMGMFAPIAVFTGPIPPDDRGGSIAWPELVAIAATLSICATALHLFMSARNKSAAASRDA